MQGVIMDTALTRRFTAQVSLGTVFWVFCALLSLTYTGSTQADTTDFRHNVDLVGKTLSSQGVDHNYYGLAYRITQFGFVTFNIAALTTPDDVSVETNQLTTPGYTRSLQSYYGAQVSLIYAISRFGLEFSYLLGQGIGYEREQSGDTLGVCHCVFSLNEAALALTFNLASRWDIGVQSSRLKYATHTSQDYDGRGLFIRYSW